MRSIPFAANDYSGERFVRADRLKAPVYASRTRRAGRGTVRLGTVLSAEPAGQNEHCSGTWYEIGAGGYICTTIGFDAYVHEPDANNARVEPLLNAPLPYRYAMVSDRSAYRFESLPTEHEYERVQSGVSLPGLGTQLDGDYFIALPSEGAEPVEGPGGPYHQTVAGRYVPVSAVEPVEASILGGVYAASGLSLPLAFVYKDDAPALRGAEPVSVQRYWRHVVAGYQTHADVQYAEMGETLVARDALRFATLHERPAEVEASEKWIHVDLDEQVLVAYQGDTPVFATLVASGKDGYDTPDGLFRIRHKYVSTTMRGEDPTDGVYDVAEVPWTMYYQGSYALHGAYWHDAFGDVRSHGCTNIAPTDARFLFTWTSPTLPEEWHGVREDGTWVLLTREEQL